MSSPGIADAGPCLSKEMAPAGVGGTGDTFVTTVFEKLLSSAASAVLPSSPSSIVLSGSTTEVFSRSPAAAAATVPLTVIVALEPAFTRPSTQVTVWSAMLQANRLVALTLTGAMRGGERIRDLDAERVARAEVVHGQGVGDPRARRHLEWSVLADREVWAGAAGAAALHLGRGRRRGRVGLGGLRRHNGGNVVDRRAGGRRDDAADRHRPRPGSFDGPDAAGDLGVRLGAARPATGAHDVEQRGIPEAHDAVDLVGQDDVVDLCAPGVRDDDGVEDLAS